MNESPGSFESLSIRVNELEKRVHALEHPDEVRASSGNRVIGAANAASDDVDASLQTANIFPLLGRAMLGIAGAYVLRAVAEAGVMPKILVAAVAIAYSFAWLTWAARVSKAAGIAPLRVRGDIGGNPGPDAVGTDAAFPRFCFVFYRVRAGGLCRLGFCTCMASGILSGAVAVLRRCGCNSSCAFSGCACDVAVRRRVAADCSAQ